MEYTERPLALFPFEAGYTYQPQAVIVRSFSRQPAYDGRANWLFQLPKPAELPVNSTATAELVEQCPYGQVGTYLWAQEPCDPLSRNRVLFKYQGDRSPRWKESRAMPRHLSRATFCIREIWAQPLRTLQTRMPEITPEFLQAWDQVNREQRSVTNPWVWGLRVTRVAGSQAATAAAC